MQYFAFIYGKTSVNPNKQLATGTLIFCIDLADIRNCKGY